jgi:hypothetical protein
MAGLVTESVLTSWLLAHRVCITFLINFRPESSGVCSQALMSSPYPEHCHILLPNPKWLPAGG